MKKMDAKLETKNAPGKPVVGPPAPVVAAKGPGRPPKSEQTTDPRARALDNLQYSVDRANAYVHDGATSYARRAKRAAKVGISRDVVSQGLDSIKAAIADAEAVIQAAYSDAAPKEIRTRSRVHLG